MPPLPSPPVVIILAAEDRFQATPDHPEHSAAETIVWQFWRHRSGVPGPVLHQLRGPWPAGLHPEAKTFAYVNHGRWVVSCPWGCNSAQYASRDDRRFFCVECDNGGGTVVTHFVRPNHPQWVPVIWPSNADVATIEALLSLRPETAAQNWLPGEPIENLAAENEARGVR